MVDVDQVFSTAVCDIECLACCFRGCKTCFEIGFDDVLDIGKIPALSAVSVDGRLLVIQKQLDDLGQYCGIRTVGILSAPENIEIAHAVGV